MRLREREEFMTIHTEGAILPPDLLAKIREGDGDLEGLRSEDYHLNAGEKLNERVSRSWNRVVGAWATFRSQAERVKEDDPGTTVTRERWLLPLFEELGYGRLQTSKAHELNGKSYPISHEWGCAPIHLVGVNVPLDRRTAGVAGAARTSPHSLVQEFLNRSDDHLWAFLSNGLQLRILRDNASLTRQAFVEFDLEAMMEGEVYADFVLLWLLCHQSRVEGDVPEEFWLERWSQTAQEQGTRALEQLREGVEAAISILGAGYLTHPANLALKERLREGDLGPQDYYRQLLRMVYRLIFLFVAEDRELLFDPEAKQEAKTFYREHYSTARLRRLAERRRGTRHPDLYRGLCIVMEKLGMEEGCTELGLPGLGGFLWSEEAVADLAECQLSNRELLEVVRNLAFTEENHIRRAVDYKNLGPEELGSVYESLLELQPEMNVDAPTFELRVVGGSERKTTGSYYTPTSLIQCLLDSALDPVIEEASKEDDPEKALLNLKICDPATGSGHFLVAAAHRLARSLASVRTGDAEPSPEAQRTAVRDVIGRCIYGVDINPMAVELCKVNLWLEALDPGKPLTFLDDQILCGNSLLGTTPALMEKGIPDEAFKPIEGDDRKFASSLRKQNKQERSGQMSMFAEFEREERVNYALLQKEAIGIAEMDDSSVRVVREKGKKYRALLESDAYQHSKLLADAWCAAFLWHKTVEAPEPITEASYRELATNPKSISTVTKKEIEQLAEQYQFFHWHLAFPGVFWLPEGEDESENEITGWSGGFELLLGNPPWEMEEVRDQEFFSGRYNAIAECARALIRQEMIESLRNSDPILYKTYSNYVRRLHSRRAFYRNSGRYPLASIGRLNTYRFFVELRKDILNSKGYYGQIVPSGIATDAFTQAQFKEIVQSESLVAFYHFENEALIFPAIHHATKFCMLVVSNTGSIYSKADMICFARAVRDLSDEDRYWSLSYEDVKLFNPNTETTPLFRSNRDAQLTKHIYEKFPILIPEKRSREDDYWQIKLQLMFMMNGPLLRTDEELINGGYENINGTFIKGDSVYILLYEGKMIWQYDHRFGTYEGQTEAQRNQGKLPELDTREHNDPRKMVRTRYWVPEHEVRAQVGDKSSSKWFLAFRDITSSVVYRTAICTVLPYFGVGATAPLIHLDNPIDLSFCFLACFNALVFDFVVRQKIGGTHLTFSYVNQLPMPSPGKYSDPIPWDHECRVRDWITPRVSELIITSWDMEMLSIELGLNSPPFKWDAERRHLIRCELDAFFFHFFSIKRPDVDYILDTFHVMRQYDERDFGEYRTKRDILEIFDVMQRAIETGEAYQTRLDPPPADPRVAHEG